ncbi:MAG: type III pantothenate kinase [Chitinophagales bacterium]|nr:type III pantothenate kinase [Chitinophagales bacterium]
MDLAIDIGNNYTKLAVFKGSELVYSAAYKKFKQKDLMDLYGKYTIERAILSEVSGDKIKTENYIKEHSAYLKLDTDTPLPINNQYKTPKTLGKDRIAAAVGAKALYPDDDVLVIDAGTCITYELATADNEYKGGGISPGIRMRFKALKRYTGRLPLLEKEQIDYLIGGNTQESMLSGVINGTAAEINGIIQRYRELYPGIKVVLTGGDSKFFESYVKSDIFVVPYLVLYGLHKILLHNAASIR